MFSPVQKISNQKRNCSRCLVAIIVVAVILFPQIGIAQTIWTGNTSTTWNVATNWNPAVVPKLTTNVIIPSGRARYPVFNPGSSNLIINSLEVDGSFTFASGNTITVLTNATIGSTGIVTLGGALIVTNDVTVSGGGLLTIGGGTLNTGGVITSTGGINAVNGTIAMSGSAPQNIGGSMFTSSTIQNLFNGNSDPTTGLTINTSDPVNITGQLTLDQNSLPILNTNDGLILVSSASNTANVAPIAEDGSGVAQATINGNITVERYFDAHRRWRLITAPVQSSGAPTISAAWQEGGQSIAGSLSNPSPGFGTHITGPTSGAFVSSTGYDQSANNSASIAWLADDTTWYAFPNTFASVTDNQGCMIFIRGDRSFPVYTGTSLTPATCTTLRTTGKLNIGRVTIPVNNGFTLIGNPYAATINFNNVYNEGGTSVAVPSNSFSLWDPNIGSAANVANGTGGWITLTSDGAGGYFAAPDPQSFDGIDVNGDIQSGAAFVVNGSGSGSVEIDEEDKVTGNDGNIALFRPAASATLPSQILSTTLYATDTSHNQDYLADGITNVFSSSFDNTLNWNKDVKKLFNLSERLSILKSNQNLSIEKSALAQAGDTIHLSVRSLKVLPYKLVIATKSFARPDLTAFLIDSFTHTSTPILLGDTAVNVNFIVTTSPASYAANRFNIVFAAAPGAVTYSDVTATQQSKNIAVQWIVSNQLNINKYVVEKSIDNTNFYPVDTTVATENASATYNWLDVNAVVGINYYRIRSVDNTGAISYSKTVSAIIGKGIISGMQLYPNPVTNGTLQLQMNNVPSGEYGIKVISGSGQILLTETISHGATSETKSITTGKSLASGIYILEIVNPDKTITKINFENL
jgi:hypothetical protein